MLKLRVASKAPLTDQIVSLTLESVSGEPLPGVAAGAHINLHLGTGLSRQYSICNPGTSTKHYELAVLIEAESRGGSKAVAALEVGDIIEADESQNHFGLKTASNHRLFAAGIGITPMLAMARELHARGSQFDLLYRAKSPERAAFYSQLQQCDFSEACRFSLSSDGGLDLAAELASPQADEQLYVCGPQRFIDALIDAAKEAGWRTDQINREYFNAAVPEVEEGDQPFTVRLKSTGDEYLVPVDQTIAEVLEDAGVFVPLSCESGVCGTCLVDVVSGEPDHRDLYQSEEEQASNRQMTVCCSRSKTPLIEIDL
ncbi:MULTISPECIES: PDR/VanB family oxidoreductase [unclassified Marinobacterium]|uniref:PDR/VanB family oxidoreductase n=1 Tax=unclassified Marinobacterium TaxID=2644139 RepID=UPI0015698EEE|nr:MULTISPECIES: PDR/VanB family oxidoreductase [unclassified Marinobacterium]NRP51723.1 Phthalate dioxygenase reductase [Marinobacterium sp. xm-v-242]NRP76304.1 Phthalate dioxygenase reductase [Marinobacterium sp. xm-m-383]